VTGQIVHRTFKEFRGDCECNRNDPVALLLLLFSAGAAESAADAAAVLPGGMSS
jgi:hypothetical protein